MAHTFKVGDIVVGVDAETYGKVTAVHNATGRMDIRIIRSGDKSRVGRLFTVDQSDFLYYPTIRTIRKTVYSPPATVVFWSDGTKTVAKCAPHERFDREKGLAIACAKKLLGDGYADAFKEFREPVNRVLSIDEVRALPEGAKVWVEHPIDAIFEDGAHQVKKREHIGLVLEDCSGYFWNPAYVRDFGCRYRVWLLPRKPTEAELRANPWKREKCE